MNILAKGIQDLMITLVVIMALMSGTITYSAAKTTESLIVSIVSGTGDSTVATAPIPNPPVVIFDYDEPDQEETRYHLLE